ncbi:hypothetical protein L2X99_11305 [Microbacterium sp. KUDC0406]|uniref:hypothetical protein n=1 Tax=Microbacterium sp. KUDC0406 TaxID=2909588 RepID=UPI001F28D696|nr:hypothetical protein [Microbacterium sp. KUDC0406]UJP09053.1 hypothetical protein L2X99_11305 [Microbacterium sp. KUDC0406]
MTSFGLLESPVGVIGVESDGTAITRVTWTTEISAVGGDPVLSAALEQLAAYFAGERTAFDIPFDLGRQTPVTRAVLETPSRRSGMASPSPTASSPRAAEPRCPPAPSVR